MAPRSGRTDRSDASPQTGSMHCPVCSRPNDCDLAAGKSSCWCAGEKASPELTDWVRAQGRDEACLCSHCRAGQVPSPCLRVCSLDRAKGVCNGCFRTMDEIVDWPLMGAADRARVLQRIQAGPA